MPLRLDWGRAVILAFAALGLLTLAACSHDQNLVQASYPEQAVPGTDIYTPNGQPIYKGYQGTESMFGKGGALGGLFGGGSKPSGGVPGGGIAVNAYLWRASLDTVSFMPLASADPFGGVIITDWYSTQKAPNERFKLVIYIVSRQLLATGVKVAVYKQTRENGTWTDAPVKPDTAVKIENAILTRAQQLRSGASS